MRYLLTIALTFMVISSGASADGALRYYNSLFHNYFAKLGYLPVIAAPESEVPGDIYSDFAALQRVPFKTRSITCFDDVIATETNSILPSFYKINESGARFNLAVPVGTIIDASVSASGEQTGQIRAMFSDVNVRSFTEDQVRLAISRPANRDCADALEEYRQTPTTGGPTEIVPAILGTVVYARQVVEIDHGSRLEGGAFAELKEKIGRLPANIGIDVSTARITKESVSVTSSERFPVAWIPALISITDVQRMWQLEENGFFLRFRRWIGLEPDRQEEIEAMRNEFFEQIPNPKIVFDQMKEGPSQAFDRNNPEHLDYMRRKAIQITIAVELFSG